MKFPRTSHTIADNFQIIARVGSMDQFERVFSVAFNESSARYYAETTEYGLIFFWYLSDHEMRNLNRPMSYPVSTDPKEPEYANYIIRRLPEDRMSTGSALEFAKDWLADLSHDDFEKMAGPTIENWDIEHERGVIVSTGDVWNHIGTHSGSICYIKPYWMWLGK